MAFWRRRLSRGAGGQRCLVQLSADPLGSAGARMVGLDSNALTYLVEALDPAYDPGRDNTDTAADRIAMVRIFTYGGIALWVSPTTQAEYDRIREPSRHLRHQRTVWILLSDAPLEADESSVEARSEVLLPSHPQGRNDCRVLAEVEAQGLGILVTRDEYFATSLQLHTPVLLLRPTAFWSFLGIGPGARPIWEPVPPHPLAFTSWWRL